MVGAAMRFGTGDAAGRKLFCTGAVGDMLLGGAGTGERFEGVQPGDEVAVDNREYLAYTYFHRYQVDANAPEYAQFRVDGRPLYPQRAKNFARSGLLSGGTPRGEFTGKMIVVQNAHDAACWPNAAISYRARLSNAISATRSATTTGSGSTTTPRTCRRRSTRWAIRRCPRPVSSTTAGHSNRRLRDLMEWVENGTEPPAETGYTLDADQRLTLAPAAAERGGVQPVVHASANGSVRADVAVGEPVTLAVEADAPAGGGTIIGVEWDFDGTGAFPFSPDGVDGSRASVRLETTHAFDTPGTYYPSVRVTAHRDGDVDAAHCRLVNLGRVRVVVS